ncbi:MAG: NUDIX domain-containing protein [Micromonosporaceae bacterium]
MITRRSSGLLLHRTVASRWEVLIGHMGGPLWSRRDAAAWSVPKGEHEPGEESAAAARREFTEELGIPAPDGELIDLGSVTQSNKKIVTVYAIRADPDLSAFSPGTFEMEWPRGSGQLRQFPEIDRVRWFALDEAREKLVRAQREFLDRLAAKLAG